MIDLYETRLAEGRARGVRKVLVSDVWREPDNDFSRAVCGIMTAFTISVFVLVASSVCHGFLAWVGCSLHATC
jgi:hypothetical protein